MRQKTGYRLEYDKLVEAIDNFMAAIKKVVAVFKDCLLRTWYGMPWRLKALLLAMEGRSCEELVDYRSDHYWGRLRLARRDLWL